MKRFILIAFLLSPLSAHAAITHGPVVGAVTDGSARIVLRCDDTTTWHIELSEDPAEFADSILSEETTSSTEKDYFGRVSITGLEPSTQYHYRAVLDGMPTETLGSFSTFPVPGSVPTAFAFGFGSGQQNVTDDESNDGRIWPEVDSAGLDFFMQIGDWTYPDYAWEVENSYPPYFHQVPWRIEASYKTRYDPDYPMHEIFDTVPIEYVYDDHDYAHNNADGSYPDKFNALAGYQAYFPGYDLPHPEEGVFHRFTCGNAEFFMLDNRTQRDPNTSGFLYYDQWVTNPATRIRFAPDENHRLLGEKQLAWLIDALASSTATWKFLVSTMTWNPGNRAVLELAACFQGDPRFDPVDTPIGSYSAAAVAIEAADGGSAFPITWARLIDGIVDNNVENVIFITGDTHTVGIDKGENSLIPEIMAGGLDRSNSMLLVYQEMFGIFTWSGEGQHIWQGNFDEHYGKVTVYGDESVLLEAYDPDGDLIASHTVLPGYLPEKVSLTISTSSYYFETIKAECSASFPVTLINTGAETLVIESLSGLGGEFSWRGLTCDLTEQHGLATPFTIPPCGKQVIALGFEPQVEGVFTDTLTVVSNDPDGAVIIAVGGQAAAPDSLPGPLLANNFPNPFNPGTTISYRLSERGHVRIDVMDVQGRLIECVLDEFREAGPGEVIFDARDQASGVYIYRIRSMGRVQTRKMMLLR